MNKPNKDREQRGDRKLMKEQAQACGPGCGCNSSGGPGRMCWILGVVILAAAAVMAIKAIMKAQSVSADKGMSGFATGDISSITNNSPAATDPAAAREISALSELNTVAADTNAVFVFLPDRKDDADGVPMAQIQSAVRTLETQGIKLGIFTLKPGGRDYQLITAQVAVPGMLVMVKGRGMSAVSGEITEAKLVQAFVGAARSGGCGPSAGSGCCPR